MRDNFISLISVGNIYITHASVKELNGGEKYANTHLSLGYHIKDIHRDRVEFVKAIENDAFRVDCLSAGEQQSTHFETG
jgi:hypothetical protein